MIYNYMKVTEVEYAKEGKRDGKGDVLLYPYKYMATIKDNMSDVMCWDARRHR